MADRSGTPVSTLRYYERIGLVEPSGRAGNNYRIYDESVVRRLAFITQAKSLGLSLDEVSGLVDAWAAGDCRSLQRRLQACVSDQADHVRGRMDQDYRRERRLRQQLGRLKAASTAPACTSHCGCSLEPIEDLTAPIACLLDDGDRPLRLAEWRRLLAVATAVERRAGWLRAVLDRGALGEVSRLCAAEVDCCPFLTCHLDISNDAVVLTIRGPLPAGDLLRALAG